MYKKELRKLLSSVNKKADIYAVDFVNFNGLADDYWADNDIFSNFNDMIFFINDILENDYISENMGCIIKTYIKKGKYYVYLIGSIITAQEIQALKIRE